jgi:hypothetical protein
MEDEMNARTYLLITASIFGILAAAHLARLVFHFPIVLGSWSVPMWISILGVIVPGFFSWSGYRLAGEKRS